MQEQTRLQALKFELLRREIRIGIEQIERGETVDGEQFFRLLDEELDG